MNPEALILFYQPNHLIKNRKYLLGLGNNFVGSSPSNEVHIDDKHLPERAASIIMRSNLLTLVRIDDMCNVLVESNLVPKTKVFLEKGVECILVPDKQFQIGRWRGLFKIIDREQARLIKGVVNRDVFEFDTVTKKSDLEEDVGNNLVGDIPEVQRNPEERMAMESTFVLPFDNLGPTFMLPQLQNDNHNDTEQLQPSIHQEEQMPATVQDQSAFKHKLQTQHREDQGMGAAEPSSMPKTLNSEHKAVSQNSNEMPKTLENDHRLEEETGSYADNAATNSNIKTGIMSCVSDSNLGRRSEQVRHEYNSYPERIKKSQSEVREPMGFEDILGEFVVKEKQTEEEEQRMNSSETSGSKINRKPITSRMMSMQEGGQVLKSTTSNDRTVAIAGFKPNEFQKFMLIKKNMRLVEGPEDDYDILVVSKVPKITKRLMMAVVQGKEIISESYLSGGCKDVLHKFHNIPWEVVIKPTSRANLFEGKRFFLSESLHNYREVIELCGGAIVQSLTKVKGNVILVLGKEDDKLFQKYKSQKSKEIYCEVELQKAIFLNRLPEERVGAEFFE